MLFWYVRSCLNYYWVLPGPVSSLVCKQFSEFYIWLRYESYMWSSWRITGRLFWPLFWLQQQIEIEYFSIQTPGFAWMWIITVTFCNISSERIGYLAQCHGTKRQWVKCHGILCIQLLDVVAYVTSIPLDNITVLALLWVRNVECCGTHFLLGSR